MRGLIFVGMLPPNSHNPEERRFVEELASHVPHLYYLRGVGIKSLRFHQIRSLPARVAPLGFLAKTGNLRARSLLILPGRTGAWRRFNTRWLRRQLLGLTGGRPYKWNLWTRFPSPELVDALESLAFARVVYEPIDWYAAAEDLSSGERRRIMEAEVRLARRAIVVTGALTLAERFRTAPGGSHWLPFGRDLCRRVQGRGIPLSILRPRLCVVAELDWRIDEALLCRLAAQHPEWQLIMAGPRRRPWGSQLARHGNVHWLGQLPAAEVGAVIADSDVALIPYRVNDWTRACLPVKVFEYLAEAKPIVATPLPELSLLKDVVTIVSAGQFDIAVGQAMSQTGPNTSQLRRQASTRFTLQARASQAAKLLHGEAILAPTA